MASQFIPNSFQHPNIYVDKYMSFLTNNELRVLIYMMRRIFGFHKRQDNISLSQITEGIVTMQGERLDYGAGLSRPAAVKAISGLTQYGLVVEVEDNDPATNNGKCYALELDESRVNFEGLFYRKGVFREVETERTQKGRDALEAKRPVNPIDQQEKKSGKSHLPGLVNDIDRAQLIPLTHNRPVETQKETTSHVEKSNNDFPRAATIETPQQSLFDNLSETTTDGYTVVESKQPVLSKERAPKKPDALFDAIAEVWQSAPGMTGKIKQQLTGKIPEKKPDYVTNFDVPTTPEEVRAFGEWYTKTCKGCPMPLSRDKIQNHFYAFRRAHSAKARKATPKTRVQNGRLLEYNSDSMKWYDIGPAPLNYQPQGTYAS